MLRKLNIRHAITLSTLLQVVATAGLIFAITLVVVREDLQARTSRDMSEGIRVGAAFLGQAARNNPVRVNNTEEGEIESVRTARIPTFADSALIDTIREATGLHATLYALSRDGQQLESITTTLVDEEGERTEGAILDADSSPVVAAIAAGEVFIGDETYLGEPYVVHYQPVLTFAGAPIGALAVADTHANAFGLLITIVTDITIVLFAAVSLAILSSLLLSGRLMRPLVRVATQLETISGGDLSCDVTETGRKDAIGKVARGLAQFREGLIQQEQEREERRLERVAAEEQRHAMMETLQREVGSVVEAAVAGDFSQRVDADFNDEAMRLLGDSVNRLVQTTEAGIDAVVAITAAIAEQDLTQRVTGDFQGRFAALQTNVNSMADHMVQMFTQVRDATISLSSAAEEMETGAGDLSMRTTQQAASLEETSAAAEELSKTVAQNAERADVANGQVRTAADQASQGGEVMRRASEAMARITESSAKVSEIIGLIENIAFQTNLLALNASVEAARAGDAGKGFAVVASEVRRLAQSAAEASQEIKDLILTSAEQVEGGSALVNDAAERLQAIVGGVQLVSDSIAEIATSSREQAISLDELNSAVRRLDEMTQQNAALVEETTAATSATKAQSTELARMVERVRLSA